VYPDTAKLYANIKPTAFTVMIDAERLATMQAAMGAKFVRLEFANDPLGEIIVTSEHRDCAGILMPVRDRYK
jgi:hypothetical protein